jgi:thymidine kinase
MRISSRAVASSRALLDLVEDDTEVVGIDEGQFFDQELPAVVDELANRGKRVIVAGLDQDYLGKPFEPMPQLLAIAEYITKDAGDSAWLCAIQPITRKRPLWRAGRPCPCSGPKGRNEARCRACFDPMLERAAAQATESDPPRRSLDASRSRSRET